jgi:hypothetical protein
MASNTAIAISTSGGKVESAKDKKRTKNKPPNVLARLEACETGGAFGLDLSDLSLSAFPREAILVPDIRELRVFNNNIAQFPPLKEFKYLDYLDFSRAGLLSIPVGTLSSLSNIKYVNLCRNSLESLPEDISSLRMLEQLVVHRNKLKGLPMGLGILRYLKSVDASFNEITVVGPIFENSMKLEELNLSNNPDIDVDSMDARTRRLYEKRAVQGSKASRRALIQRALGVQRDVLTREQQIIFRAQHDAKKKGMTSEYP